MDSPLPHAAKDHPDCDAPHEQTSISIVIPVYNSAETIDLLCELLLNELSSTFRLQIVLVNDGSTDNSANVCRELHEQHPENIDCILLARNFGEHNAVMAGLNHAQGDYCVIMDDDLQNPPAGVLRLIQEAQKGYDVVYVRYDHKAHHFLRNFFSYLHNRMAVYALDKPANLYLSSFKIISRLVVQEAIHYTGPDPYIDAIILRTTRNIGVVPVQHYARKNGASGYTLVKLISLWGNMIVSFSLYPLRLIGALGLFMVLAGIVYQVYSLVAWALPQIQNPSEYQSLTANMWFFRGITMFSISVIGEYIGRIYMHLNHTPQFIIQKKFIHHPTDRPCTASNQINAATQANKQ